MSVALMALSAFLCSCARDYAPTALVKEGAVISVRDQKMAIMRQGEVVKTFPVSTSKFGLGDQRGSYRTPLGVHSIARKIGAGQPSGMVFKSRKPTGERIEPDAPGRDPIVTRIMWLRGREAQNRNAYSRLIYIHGTAEERTIGTPASYGCIRMTSADVTEAYDLLKIGDPVVVERCSISASLKALEAAKRKEDTLLAASNVKAPSTPATAIDAKNVKTAPALNIKSGKKAKPAKKHKAGKSSKKPKNSKNKRR